MVKKNEDKGIIELVPHDDFCNGDKECTCQRSKTVLAIRRRITKVIMSYYKDDENRNTNAINEIMRGEQ